MTKSFSARAALTIILAGLAVSPAFASVHHRDHDHSGRTQRYISLVEQAPPAETREQGHRDPFPLYGVGEYSPVTDQ